MHMEILLYSCSEPRATLMSYDLINSTTWGRWTDNSDFHNQPGWFPLVVRGQTAAVCPHLLVEAADGQELAAGAPGQSLDPQGPLVGTEAGEEPSIQGVEQHLVLFGRVYGHAFSSGQLGNKEWDSLWLQKFQK